MKERFRYSDFYRYCPPDNVLPAWLARARQIVQLLYEDEPGHMYVKFPDGTKTHVSIKHLGPVGSNQ